MRIPVLRDLPRDLLICAATASLLFVGPWLDLLLHPDSPLWLPWATMPDVSVYVAVFRRAAEGALLGDPFVWEHRVDPSSVFTAFAFWPGVFGKLTGAFGDGVLPLAGWGLSTLWFFGLFRLAKALGQPAGRAFGASGVACFFAVNLAYNLNGYKLNFGAWNLALTEHLRVYPTVASMAVYALAAWRLYAAIAGPSTWRVGVAGVLVAATAPGRPFDWMVLETAGGLLAATLYLSGRKRPAFASATVMLLGGALAAPVILRLALHQARHATAFNDLMWRGIYQAKSWGHYGKYSLALAAVGILLFLAFRRALDGKRLRDWPLAAVFPALMVVASLLPYYHTLPKRVTVTGFAYFFVFSFSTWTTMALFQAGHLAAARRRPAGDTPWMAVLLLSLLLIQQLALGLGQRARQAANVIPGGLREVYRHVREGSPPGTVILAQRNGTEVVAETGGWLFSPTPAVAALLSPTPTAELLERALWAEFLLGGDLDALAPLFADNGLPGYEAWKSRQGEATRMAVERLEKRVGYNTFVFHPRLNRWDLQTRGLALPKNLASERDFVAWFTPELRPVFAKVRATASAGVAPPFKLDLVILGPGTPADSSRLAALGFRPSRFPGGIEVWSREGKRPGSP